MASWFQVPLGPMHLPNFVSAPSAQALRGEMRIVNKRHKSFVVYQQIQWIEAEKKWYAWYYVTESIEAQLRELESDQKKKDGK